MESDLGRDVPLFPALCAPLQVGPDGLTTVACLSCRGSLDFHQPDSDLPHRMLATCPACKCWHLVETQTQPRNQRVFVVLLPESRAFGRSTPNSARKLS